ncbi:MAG: DUF924 domain-containing protein [Betaproteobacteria bacterium]|nr:DUF924 domain-containing protein [Betaproteobacteria bacterium]
MSHAPLEILDFWFGTAAEGPPGPRKLWFSKNPAVDTEIRERFLDDYGLAAEGKLPGWQAAPEPCLALILLLDQFPRNMFRDTPLAFATDPLALAAAKQAVGAGFDTGMPNLRRMFLYLPFEHSEALADQDEAVRRLEAVKGDPQMAAALDYAHRHREVIRRFGRFPHRNAILGRESTAEEREFLRQSGSSF